MYGRRRWRDLEWSKHGRTRLQTGALVAEPGECSKPAAAPDIKRKTCNNAMAGKWSARNYGLTRLIQGDITSLPFAQAAFDGLVSMDVVVHLPRGDEGHGVENSRAC